MGTGGVREQANFNLHRKLIISCGGSFIVSLNIYSLYVSH
jgi:hypothetical protein